MAQHERPNAISDILPSPMMGPENNVGLGAVPIPLCGGGGGAGSGFSGKFAISSLQLRELRIDFDSGKT